MSYHNKGTTWAFFLLASCFLWWGIANNLTDPLVRVFRDAFEMTTFQASLIQMAFYLGYFCMALPGAIIAQRTSYKTGVLVGLGLYAAGCFLLYPASIAQEFVFFCLAYYVLASGLGILETNANPYVLTLGSPETATRRLNFAQAFNPIGAITGVLLAKHLVMSNLPTSGSGELLISAGNLPSALATVVRPYLLIAVALTIVWVLILISRMPRAAASTSSVSLQSSMARLLRNKVYVFSVVAQFCYVGTQISVWTYTNFYIPEVLNVSQSVALTYHTWGLVAFASMRWVFAGLMRYVGAAELLLVSCCMAILATVLVIFAGGLVGVLALVAVSGFMSLMFPTIFGLGCANLGADTKLASSGQIMAIVGGAIITPLQGAMLDLWGVRQSYWLPIICFTVIAIFAVLCRIRGQTDESGRVSVGD